MTVKSTSLDHPDLISVRSLVYARDTNTPTKGAIMVATLEQVTFRDILGKPLFIEYPIADIFDDLHLVPPEANAALVYGYIDPQAGLTFDFLAPAQFTERRVFHEAAPLVKHNSRVIIRRGSVPNDARIAFPENAEELLRQYAEQVQLCDEYYQVGRARELTRELTEIDHLRNQNYPDDVEVLLFDGSLPMEQVWFTLLGIFETGSLVGKLLNEPYADYPVHYGDKMALAPINDPNGVLKLATTPDMLVESSSDSGQSPH